MAAFILGIIVGYFMFKIKKHIGLLWNRFTKWLSDMDEKLGNFLK